MSEELTISQFHALYNMSTRRCLFENKTHANGHRSVYVVKRNKNEVILKVFTRRKAWQQEKTILENALPDIVAMNHAYTVYNDSKTYYIIEMEKADCDLLTYIDDGIPDEGEARRVFAKIVKCCKNALDQHVAHRDLKLENILVFDDGNVLKLTDLELSCYCDDNLFSRRSDQVGTWNQMCPNKLNGVAYNVIKSEVWSLGVLLYNLITGRYLYKATRHSTDETFQTIYDRKWEMKGVSAPLKDLFGKMLDPDETARISFEGILDHPWVVAGENKREY